MSENPCPAPDASDERSERPSSPSEPAPDGSPPPSSATPSVSDISRLILAQQDTALAMRTLALSIGQLAESIKLLVASSLAADADEDTVSVGLDGLPIRIT